MCNNLLKIAIIRNNKWFYFFYWKIVLLSAFLVFKDITCAPRVFSYDC